MFHMRPSEKRFLKTYEYISQEMCIGSNIPTPRSRVLLEDLIVTKIIKIFPSSYKTEFSLDHIIDQIKLM